MGAPSDAVPGSAAGVGTVLSLPATDDLVRHADPHDGGHRMETAPNLARVGLTASSIVQPRPSISEQMADATAD